MPSSNASSSGKECSPSEGHSAVRDFGDDLLCTVRASGASIAVRAASVLMAALAMGACASGAARGPVSVAVMPVDTLGVPAAEASSFHGALLRELGLSRTARPAAAKGAAQPSRCRDSDECLAGVGRRLAASLVLSSTLAGLGDMRLIRARLVRASDALVVQDLQETVPGGAGTLDQRAADLIRRLFPERVGRAWYRRWWVWVGVGLAVAAAGVTTWLVIRRSQQPAPDNVHHIGDL
jgi:hypothetical protein